MAEAAEPLVRAVAGPTVAAALVALAFFAGLGTWAALAPLTGAAVAPGFVGVEVHRKTVQHLEGGIIAEIAVREGHRVPAGALLVRFDDMVARSTYELLDGQFLDSLAEQARLEAERARRTGIEFPAALTGAANRERAAQAMRIQRDLFESRRETLQSRIRILERRILSLREQISGFHAQVEAAERQLATIRKEEAVVEIMVKKGLTREPRLLALQRSAAEIEGLVGEITSRIAQAEIKIGETELEMVDLEHRTINQVVGDLRSLAGRIADMGPRLRAARDTLRRTEVRAPVAGTVVALQFHTVGGIVPPGGRILDMVPADTSYMIEAQVSPTDIDVVRPGLPAEVRLTAFSARTTPTVTGRVVHVSADRLIDQASSQPYYAVHVKLDREGGAEGGFDLDLADLYPGMPVEVMVVTGRHTVLDYLIRPVVDTFARAFREG